MGGTPLAWVVSPPESFEELRAANTGQRALNAEELLTRMLDHVVISIPSKLQ